MIDSLRAFGDEQAGAYSRRIHCVLRLLAEQPDLARRRSELGLGVLSFPVKSHILYVRLSERSLVVSHTLHARQDLAREAWEVVDEMSEPD